MNFSAARSSSAAVTPGRTFPESRSIVRTRISPARAILSISAGVFLTIMASESLFEPERGERRADVVVNLARRAGAVEAPQQAQLVVVVDQRFGLPMIDPEPRADLVRVVVVATGERPPALVAHALVLGRVEILGQPRGLGALTGAGRAEQDEVQFAHISKRRGEVAGFPATGGGTLLQEAFVVAHHELRL